MTNNLAKILLLNTFVLIFFNFAHPITPEMLISKNMPDSINGIMFSLMSLGMVVGSPYFGKKLNTTKSRNIMITSLIGYGVAQQLFCFGQTILIMGIGRFLSGFMAGGWIVTSIAYVNQNTTEDNKTKFLAYIMVSNSLAAIIGQIISGALGVSLKYEYIFFFQFIGLFITSLLVFSLKDNNLKTSIKNVSSKNPMKNKTIKEIAVPLVLMTLFAMAYTSLNSQAGYYVTKSLHKQTIAVAFVNSYISFITLIVNLLIIDKLYKKIKFPDIFILKSIISLVGLILLFFSIINGLFALTLFMVGVVSYRPVLQKISLEKKSLDPGIVIGYLNSSNSVGMVSGSFLSGFLYGISPSMVLIFAFIILIVIFLISIASKVLPVSQNR